MKTIKKAVAKRKAKKVLAIPKGYHSVTPYLVVDNASAAIEFYQKAFGAKKAARLERPDGKIAHAELTIGDSKVMLADECPEKGAHSPKNSDTSSITIHLYVKNVDAVIERSVAAGAKLIRPVEDMFYGDRSGGVEDPYGHKWYIATHIEDLSLTKIKKRAAELFAKNN